MRFTPSVVVTAAFCVSGFVFAAVGCPGPTTVTPDPDAGVPDAGPDGPISCADDEQCNGGFCRAGLCVDEECRDKLECGDAKVCSVEGRCVDPPEACATPADCPGTQLCDGFTDRCFDPNAPAEGEGEGPVGEGEGEGPVGEGEGEGPVGEGEGEGPVGEGEGEGPVGAAIDLGGYRLENRENAQVTVLPDGIRLEVGQVLVVGRDASQGDFTDFWEGFGAGARYLNAETDSGVPVINGQEKFALVAPGNDLVDGVTRVGASGKCYARTAQSPGANGSWTESDADTGTPGVVDAPGVHGLVITEWCDAQGGGNFVFEYIEIANLP